MELAEPLFAGQKRLRWNHDLVIDTMLADPGLTQTDIARQFNVSNTWVSILVNSDAFKERLRERKAELMDPVLRASLEEKLNGIANTALDRLAKRLDNPGLEMKNQDLIAIAKLGIGDRNMTKDNKPVTNLYVVAMPAQAQTTQSWLENSSVARPKLEVVEEIQNGK